MKKYTSCDTLYIRFDSVKEKIDYFMSKPVGFECYIAACDTLTKESASSFSTFYKDPHLEDKAPTFHDFPADIFVIPDTIFFL